MFGGAHENQRRPGTENVAGIAGMAAAAEWILRDRETEQERKAQLRDRILDEASQNVFPDAQQNGDPAPRLANTFNVSLLGVDSEMLLIALDLEGVCASSGSACMVGSVRASHVLLAMGLPMERARSAIRFSLGKWTTAEEIAELAMRLIESRSEPKTPANMPLLRQLEFAFRTNLCTSVAVPAWRSASRFAGSEAGYNGRAILKQKRANSCAR